MNDQVRQRRAARILRVAVTGACVLLVTLYAASQRWSFFAQTPLAAAELMGGVLDLHRGGAASWSVAGHNWPWRNRFEISISGGSWRVVIPLYVLAVPAILATAVVWARRPGPRQTSERARRSQNERAAPVGQAPHVRECAPH